MKTKLKHPFHRQIFWKLKGGLIPGSSVSTHQKKELLISKPNILCIHTNFILEAIKKLDELQLFRILFYTDLSQKIHLYKMKASSAKKLEIIFCWENVVPLSLIIPFYKSWIRPIAEYGRPLYAVALINIVGTDSKDLK